MISINNKILVKIINVCQLSRKVYYLKDPISDLKDGHKIIGSSNVLGLR